MSDMPANGMLCWNVRIRPSAAIRCTGRPSMRAPASAIDPARRREHAGDEIEGGGLAGAVRPDQCEDLAGKQFKPEIFDRGQAAEVLGQAADRYERLAGHVAPLAGRRLRSPARPDG